MIYFDKWLKHYKDLFLLSPNQTEFFLEQFQTFDKPVSFLDVECGPGTLVKSIAQKDSSIKITATDSIEGFITQINENSDKKSITALNVYPTDLGKRFVNQHFNVISCLDYRLIFLKDKAQILKFMFDAWSLLTDDGILIIDLINFAKFDFSEDIIKLPEKQNDNIQLISDIKIDRKQMTYQLHQKVILGTERFNKHFDVVKDEIVCPLSIETLSVFEKDTNFSSIQFFSDYNGNAFTADSDRIICVLKK